MGHTAVITALLAQIGVESKYVSEPHIQLVIASRYCEFSFPLETWVDTLNSNSKET